MSVTCDRRASSEARSSRSLDWLGTQAGEDGVDRSGSAQERGRQRAERRILGGDLRWDHILVFVPFCFAICNFLSPHKTIPHSRYLTSMFQSWI